MNDKNKVRTDLVQSVKTTTNKKSPKPKKKSCDGESHSSKNSILKTDSSLGSKDGDLNDYIITQKD